MFVYPFWYSLLRPNASLKSAFPQAKKEEDHFFEHCYSLLANYDNWIVTSYKSSRTLPKKDLELECTVQMILLNQVL